MRGIRKNYNTIFGRRRVYTDSFVDYLEYYYYLKWFSHFLDKNWPRVKKEVKLMDGSYQYHPINVYDFSPIELCDRQDERIQFVFSHFHL